MITHIAKSSRTYQLNKKTFHFHNNPYLSVQSMVSLTNQNSYIYWIQRTTSSFPISTQTQLDQQANLLTNLKKFQISFLMMLLSND